MTVQGGFGTKVTIKVGTAHTVIAHAREISAFELEKELADITAHNAPGGYAQWLDTGRRSIGELTITLTWDKNEPTHAALLAAFDSKQPTEFTFADPNSDETITFDGLIKKIGRVGEQDNAFSAEVTIQPTGQPTIA